MARTKEEIAEYIAEISRHQTAIYAFVRSMVSHAADAQDITQETNIALWKSAERFEPGTNFYAYATRIAYRKVVDHARRRKRQGALVFDTELAERLAGAVTAAAGGRAAARQAALEECVEGLGEEERRLTWLRYEQRMPVRRIAKALERSESGLQNAFSRIRRKLRLCVESKLAT